MSAEENKALFEYMIAIKVILINNGLLDVRSKESKKIDESLTLFLDNYNKSLRGE